MSGSASLDLGHVASTGARDESPADGESDGVVDGVLGAVSGETQGSAAGSGGIVSAGSGGSGYPYDELGQPPQARLSPAMGRDAAQGGNAPLDSVREEIYFFFQFFFAFYENFLKIYAKWQLAIISLWCPMAPQFLFSSAGSINAHIFCQCR